MSVVTPENETETVPSNLFAVRNFSGSRGERIEEMSMCNNDGSVMTETEYTSTGQSEPRIRYIGVVSIVNPVPGPTGGMSAIPSDARFMIDGSTPSEALENFEAGVRRLDEAIQQQQQEAMEKAQQSELVIPNAAESQAINDMGIITE